MRAYRSRESRLEAWSRTSDVLVIDAFSSDAIPVHLLTREAFEIYADALGERGLLAFPRDQPPLRSASAGVSRGAQRRASAACTSGAESRPGGSVEPQSGSS